MKDRFCCPRPQADRSVRFATAFYFVPWLGMLHHAAVELHLQNMP